MAYTVSELEEQLLDDYSQVVTSVADGLTPRVAALQIQHGQRHGRIVGGASWATLKRGDSRSQTAPKSASTSSAATLFQISLSFAPTEQPPNPFIWATPPR